MSHHPLSGPLDIQVGRIHSKSSICRWLAHQSEALRSWDVKAGYDAQLRCAPATKNSRKWCPMTRQTEEVRIERHLVIVFDICSSTIILEDLKQTDNLKCWRDLLIGLKNFLRSHESLPLLQIYKFIGDGWILLAPADTPRNDVLEFLKNLASVFSMLFHKDINPNLQEQPRDVGITVGVDRGELIRLEMNEQIEYIGRPLNVASRLQGATRELEGGRSNQALFARPTYNSLPGGRPDRLGKVVRLPLKNLRNNLKSDFIRYPLT